MAYSPDDPLLAVVSPPRVARFRELVGLAPDDTISANFTGWSKLVLLTLDLAVLFPRDGRNVEALRNEVEALRAVAPAGLAEIPEVVAEWVDVGISAYPVAAIRRLPGVTLEPVLPGLGVDALGELLEQIGALAARWHAVDPQPLLSRPPRRTDHRVGLDTMLDARAGCRSPEEAAAAVGDALRLSDSERARAARAIARARTLERVLVHGDIHEGQVLIDPERMRVTGILDWQTALVDHPFTEFNLGEWGNTIWQNHRSAFPALRRRQWNAYAAARGLADDYGAIFEWVHAVAQAMWLDERERAGKPLRVEVTGTFDEQMSLVRAATQDLAA